jgi:predicted DNA-binding protein (MmcQ/YjbR family)
MTGQRPAEKWHDVIGDHTFGDSMLYRLVYHSYRLTLTGGLSHHRRPPLLPVIREPARAIGIVRKG